MLRAGAWTVPVVALAVAAPGAAASGSAGVPELTLTAVRNGTDVILTATARNAAGAGVDVAYRLERTTDGQTWVFDGNVQTGPTGTSTVTLPLDGAISFRVSTVIDGIPVVTVATVTS